MDGFLAKSHIAEQNHRIMKWRFISGQEKETGDWAGWCPELPGGMSVGERLVARYGFCSYLRREVIVKGARSSYGMNSAVGNCQKYYL
jgi:hypothetical protein